MKNNNSQNNSMNNWPVVVALITLLVLLFASLLILIISQNTNMDLVIGIALVLGVSVLFVFLFLMSLAFKKIHLTNNSEPLGLPTGSIRALIALLLILVWVIVSIFLFSVISGIDATKRADAIKLGQQFYTTMSTLVVAIAAFYFGSNTHQDALTRNKRSPGSGSDVAPAQPVLMHVYPSEGKQGATNLPLIMTGKNFGSPKAVRLTLKGEKDIDGTNIVFNQTDLSFVDCTISLEGTPPPKPGRWNVVVVNYDDKEYQLPQAFEIQQP